MSHDVATHRLQLLPKRGRLASRRAHDLVGNDHCHAMHVSNLLELSKKDIQRLLPLFHFVHARVVSPEEACGAVNDEQAIASSAKYVVYFVEKLILVLRVKSLRTCHVFQNIFLVNAKSSGYSHQSLRPECIFSVQVQHLALTTSILPRQLACDCQRVAKLCLARTKFPEHLGYLAWFDTSTKKAVQLCRACRDLEHAPAHVQHVSATHHPNGHQMLSCRHDPLCLLHVHSSDLQQPSQGKKRQCPHLLEKKIVWKTAVYLAAAVGAVVGVWVWVLVCAVGATVGVPVDTSPPSSLAMMASSLLRSSVSLRRMGCSNQYMS